MHDSSKDPTSHLCYLMLHGSCGKILTLQPAKLRSSRRYGLWLGRSQTSIAHLIGTRVGIVVARTSRRLPTRGVKSGGGHEGTPVAGRPAEAAAGDAPTVTRHAVERKEVMVVPVIFGAPLQVGSGEGVSAPPNPVPNLPGPTVARAQPSSSAAVESSQHPSGGRIDSFGPESVVLMEVAQSVEPTTRKSMMKVSFQRDRGSDPAKPRITSVHSWMSTAAAAATC